MARPNIILVTTDQQRYDALGVAGNELIETPNLDRLAGEGVHFSNSCVQGVICVPSRACIQTGRYLHQHGVTFMERAVDNTPGLPEHERTFMEHLQDGGYFTGATGKMHMYPEKGFTWQNLTGGKGQRWRQSYGSPLGPGPLGDNYASWLEDRRPGAYEEIYAERRRQETYDQIGLMDIPVSEQEYVDTWIGQESVKFINRHSRAQEPFFLWCGFCGPHGPFDPPDPYRSQYAPESMPLPVDREGWSTWRDRYDEGLMRRTIAYYYAMVTCIDHQVGKIVEEIRSAGVEENTVIIFTSDHGEMLGERGRMGKSVFYEPVLRVPLLVHAPGCKPRTVKDVTEVMSIAPTVLDYAGIEIPRAMAATSIRPVIEGGPSSRHAAYSEYVDNDCAEWGKCVRTDTHKYFRWFASGVEEVYDLQEDPLETRNLVSDQPIKRNELRDMVFDWQARTEWRHNYPDTDRD